jgi:hypothetical protein
MKASCCASSRPPSSATIYLPAVRVRVRCVRCVRVRDVSMYSTTRAGERRPTHRPMS